MVAKPELIELKQKVNFGVDSENKTHSETRTVNQRLILINEQDFTMWFWLVKLLLTYTKLSLSDYSKIVAYVQGFVQVWE